MRAIAFPIALVFSAHIAAALAQSYPSRPPRLIVGFTPGGGVDINARVLASKLSELLPQQVIVENRPGAGTNIANEYVAKAAPDGYTLLFNSPAVVINMSLYRNPPYDALRDFAGVSVFPESSTTPRPAPGRRSTSPRSSSSCAPQPVSSTSPTKAARPRSRPSSPEKSSSPSSTQSRSART